MKPLLIEARQVSKHFGTHKVLDSVSLALHEGEIITLIGLNGSGKSTLLKVLLGLVVPDSGTVWRKPSLRVGYMPQKIAFDPVMPITAGWFLQLCAADKKQMQTVAEEVEIARLLQSPIQSLSGGELQRLMLARALLSDPELLVLDEPVQGVDMTGQAMLYNLISSISKKRGAAVLMVSHDLHLVMASTEQVICLNHHICCQGHPESVSRDPAFASLFGSHIAQSLALYTHHHDHEHDMHGEVVHRH